MARPEDHGPNVGAIALTLAGAIIWRRDPEPIERYALRYNHETGEIEMLEGSVRGDVLHSFDNETPIREMEQVFRSL